jgi:hypothetical protein
MRKQIFTRRSSSPTRKRRDFAYFGFWLGHGLSVRAATAASAAGCRSLDELRVLGWHAFRNRRNCGARTLQELSDLVGGWWDAPRKNGTRFETVIDGSRQEQRRIRDANCRVEFASTVAVAFDSDPTSEQYDGTPVARWIHRASDQTLIEELRRRGISVEYGETTQQR